MHVNVLLFMCFLIEIFIFFYIFLRFEYLNGCLLSSLKLSINVTSVGKFFWDLMALQDLMAAIEIMGVIPNYTAVVCFLVVYSFFITICTLFYLFTLVVVFNVHLKKLNLLLVGETSHLGVVLREQDGSDTPNNYLQVMLLNST